MFRMTPPRVLGSPGSYAAGRRGHQRSPLPRLSPALPPSDVQCQQPADYLPSCVTGPSSLLGTIPAQPGPTATSEGLSDNRDPPEPLEPLLFSRHWRHLQGVEKSADLQTDLMTPRRRLSSSWLLARSLLTDPRLIFQE